VFPSAFCKPSPVRAARLSFERVQILDLRPQAWNSASHSAHGVLGIGVGVLQRCARPRVGQERARAEGAGVAAEPGGGRDAADLGGAVPLRRVHAAPRVVVGAWLRWPPRPGIISVPAFGARLASCAPPPPHTERYVRVALYSRCRLNGSCPMSVPGLRSRICALKRRAVSPGVPNLKHRFG